ncbi:MAG: CPBP family intramembrane glutamic endopeptidase [Caulobacteraceae bacterium]
MIANRRLIVLTLVGLVIAMALPPLGLGRMIAPGDDLGSMLFREGVFWAILAALLAYVLFIERRPLTSLGFRRPRVSALVWGVAAGILLVAVYVLVAALVIPALHLKSNAHALQSLIATPLWFRFLLVTRAAVTEEILYRAYPIERLELLTRSRAFAAGVSVVGFTLAHLNYWGPVQLLFVGPAAVILAGLYLWRRDIWCNMLAHFITDGVGFLGAH